MSIEMISLNFDLSRAVYEQGSSNSLISAAQKIATYTVIPLALIALFEALIKNLIIINLLNSGIYVINKLSTAIYPPKSDAPPPRIRAEIPPSLHTGVEIEKVDSDEDEFELPAQSLQPSQPQARTANSVLKNSAVISAVCICVITFVSLNIYHHLLRQDPMGFV